MSSSDDEGNGVPASGNVVNNNRANNSGIGSASQNIGPGSGSHFGGNLNVEPGAVGEKSGPDSASINKFEGPANSGNGVPASGNVVDNKRANNSGIGSASQNIGPGSGSHFVGDLNVVLGAVGEKSGPDSASINKFEGPANFCLKDKTTEKSVGRGTEPASTKTWLINCFLLALLGAEKGLMSIKACLLCCLFACLLAAFYCA